MWEQQVTEAEEEVEEDTLAEADFVEGGDV